MDRVRGMERATTSACAAVLLAVLLAAAGCGGGGGDDDEVICIGGCPAQGVTKVDDSTKAKLLVQTMASAAADVVPQGTYTGKVVSGLAGTATFSGHASFARSSCGTDCTSSHNDGNVTIVFTGYRAKYGGNSEVTLTGTMTLVDTRTSRQSGQSYSSSGGVDVRATDLRARNEIAASDGRVWGEADTIDFTATSSTGSGGAWHGTLVGDNGTAYAF